MEPDLVKVSIVDLLFYFDQEQLLVGEDESGQKYLCILVKENIIDNTFMLVPITHTDLYKFEQRQEDLKNTIENREDKKWYMGGMVKEKRKVYIYAYSKEGVIPTDHLPLEGLLC